LPGTRYTVGWTIDLNTDRYSLALNGVSLVANAAFGIDVQSMNQLTFSSSFDTTGSAIIDNVSIQAVPEPGTWAMLLAGIACCGTLSARRLRQTRPPRTAPSRSPPCPPTHSPLPA
ncbi:MAG TPA: PEP-CTERM sorting domain-containing protein, partial [Piscinibacter sp.]|nr:PEP-CTERM sorting domain-containing protein [Piscinibacter sp.]